MCIRDSAVGHFEHDLVIGDQPRRAPGDLQHARMVRVHEQPVADLERLGDVEGESGEDVAEQILHRKTDDERRHAGAGEEGGGQRVLVDYTPDHQGGGEKDDEAGGVRQQARGVGCLLYTSRCV